MRIRIRSGDVRDWPFISGLSKKVIPDSISPWRQQALEETISYREKTLQGFWTWIQQTHSQVFIAESEEDGQEYPVGYLILHSGSQEELTGVTQGWVMDLAVVYECRGQGVGRELLHAAEGHCRQMGIAYLGLAVSSHNVKALRLYQACGFAEERKLMVKLIEHELPSK